MARDYRPRTLQYAINKGVITRPNSHGVYGKEYGKKCQTGDEIIMYLDLIEYTLKFSVNGIDYGNAYDKINKAEYRAAFDTDGPVIIELLKFEEYT